MTYIHNELVVFYIFQISELNAENTVPFLLGCLIGAGTLWVWVKVLWGSELLSPEEVNNIHSIHDSLFEKDHEGTVQDKLSKLNSMTGLLYIKNSDEDTHKSSVENPLAQQIDAIFGELLGQESAKGLEMEQQIHRLHEAARTGNLVYRDVEGTQGARSGDQSGILSLVPIIRSSSSEVQRKRAPDQDNQLESRVTTLYEKIAQKGTVEQSDPINLVNILHEKVDTGDIVHKNSQAATSTQQETDSPQAEVQSRVEEVYERYVTSDQSKQAQTPSEKINQIEMVLDQHTTLQSRLENIFETSMSGDIDPKSVDQLEYIDSELSKLAEIQNRINNIFVKLDTDEEETDLKRKLSLIENHVDKSNRIHNNIQEAVGKIDNRLKNDRMDDHQGVKKLRNGLNELEAKNSESDSEVRWVVDRLLEYDHVITSLQKGKRWSHQPIQPNEYNDEDLETVTTQLRENTGREELSKCVVPFVESLGDCRQKTQRLEEERNQLQQEIDTVKQTIDTIEQSLDFGAINEPIHPSGSEWMEPLDKLEAGLTRDLISVDNVSPAAAAVDGKQIETTQKGRALLHKLENPNRFNREAVETAIADAVTELGTLDAQVRTAEENAKTIERHLSLQDIDATELEADHTWVDILEMTAKGVQKEQIGIKYVQDVASDLQKSTDTSSDALKLLDHLSKPENHDRDELISTLEEAHEYVNKYHDIVGGGAKDSESRTIKQTAARLKSDVPDIGTGIFSNIIRSHIEDRENELEEISEDQIMEKYAIHQELYGLETLLTELESTVKGNVSDEVDVLASDVDQKLRTLEDRKGDLTTEFGKGIKLVDHNIELAEYFRERGLDARDQGNEVKAHERFEAASKVIEHTHTMLEGELKMYLKRVSG